MSEPIKVYLVYSLPDSADYSFVGVAAARSITEARGMVFERWGATDWDCEVELLLDVDALQKPTLVDLNEDDDEDEEGRGAIGTVAEEQA